MNWIDKLFGCREVPQVETKVVEEAKSEPKPEPIWFEFPKNIPPHEVVLAACDTYDCGWSMDTVWWYADDECWMTTGGVNSIPAHLPYTHWRLLPEYPKTDQDV